MTELAKGGFKALTSEETYGVVGGISKDTQRRWLIESIERMEACSPGCRYCREDFETYLYIFMNC